MKKKEKCEVLVYDLNFIQYGIDYEAIKENGFIPTKDNYIIYTVILYGFTLVSFLFLEEFINLQGKNAFNMNPAEKVEMS